MIQVKNRNLKTVSKILLNSNNRNTRKKCEMRSKLTIKTPERRY